MHYDVEREFESIRTAVNALEAETPNEVVQVLVGPVSARVPMGGRAPVLGKAVLRSVTLKRGSGELWVELGDGTWNLAGAKPWNPANMRVAMTGLPREARWPPVKFNVVEH
ncbi:hypothetical protein [Burkholderia gladioli]|uniref:hypothetical protein n=1 Tax=Burkholderia gladioli TaxID=28095 RepID=UPI00163F3342|nr:hypothetical protein [Burkholderia gladioli]